MAASVHILSNHNQYKGVNVHLQSRLQETNSGWSSFHDQHIHEIARALNRLLPPNYYASTKESMQIKTRTQPDTSVLPPRLDTSLNGKTSSPPTLCRNIRD